jgi:diaminopimelate decarboxylase
VIGFSQPSQELLCDGVSLSAIAAAEGTPLYVYSAALLRQRYQDVVSGFGDYPHRVHYALKANSTLAIARLLCDLGAGADANSIWEIELARKAGFAPQDIVFTGVGKSDAELECAVPLGLKAINVESAGELDRVEALAARAGLVARVAIRVNPDIDAKSHPHISTGLKINKFGMPLDEAQRLFAGFAARPALKVVAVHIHVGSQITSIDPVRSVAAQLVALARQAQDAGLTLEYLDAGGGLGISYDGGPVVSPARYAAALVDDIRSTRLPIVIEPGRSIVGPVGIHGDERLRDHRRRHDRADAPGVVRRVSPDRANPAARRRASSIRNRRPGVREHRRGGTRPHAAAAGGRRSPGHPRYRRVRLGHGVELQSPSAAGRSDRRQRHLAGRPPPPEHRRHARAGSVEP